MSGPSNVVSGGVCRTEEQAGFPEGSGPSRPPNEKVLPKLCRLHQVHERSGQDSVGMGSSSVERHFGSYISATAEWLTTRPKYRFATTNSSEHLPAKIRRDCALDDQIGVGYSLVVDNRYIDYRPYLPERRLDPLPSARIANPRGAMWKRRGVACQSRDLGGA